LHWFGVFHGGWLCLTIFWGIVFWVVLGGAGTPPLDGTQINVWGFLVHSVVLFWGGEYFSEAIKRRSGTIRMLSFVAVWLNVTPPRIRSLLVFPALAWDRWVGRCVFLLLVGAYLTPNSPHKPPSKIPHPCPCVGGFWSSSGGCWGIWGPPEGKSLVNWKKG